MRLFCSATHDDAHFGEKSSAPRLSLLPGTLRVCVVDFLRLMASQEDIVVSSLKDNSSMAVELLTQQ